MSEHVLQSAWCVIPTYNNPGTVRDVVTRALAVIPRVLVVDDGSGQPVDSLLQGLDATVIRHDENRGKGAALLTALHWVQKQGGTWMITLDADGQHHPEDMINFIPLMQESPTAILMGERDFVSDSVPASSRFGRKFSNFWVQMETGRAVTDTQSGYRAYPVALVSQLPLHSQKYDFEIEVLVRAAWAGLELKSVPVRVWYPPAGERVSSFDKVKDNVRLSRMHMRLLGRRMVPWPNRRLVPRRRFLLRELFRHPGSVIRNLLHENATPVGLGVSAGIGLLLATLPLISVHTIVILYVVTRLNLNKVMAVSIQNLCAPPVVPVLCIELGHWMRTGTFLLPGHPREIVADLHIHLLHWLLGSLVLAPVIGVIGGMAVYWIAARVQQRGGA